MAASPASAKSAGLRRRVRDSKVTGLRLEDSGAPTARIQASPGQSEARAAAWVCDAKRAKPCKGVIISANYAANTASGLMNIMYGIQWRFAHCLAPLELGAYCIGDPGRRSFLAVAWAGLKSRLWRSGTIRLSASPCRSLDTAPSDSTEYFQLR